MNEKKIEILIKSSGKIQILCNEFSCEEALSILDYAHAQLKLDLLKKYSKIEPFVLESTISD